MLKGKKGGEKLLSIWWFLVLGIVGAGIVVGVLIFYSADVNVKQTEAEFLYNNIVECLTEEGFLIEGINENNIYEKCKLSRQIIEEEGFYFKIDFSETNMQDIVKGDQSLEELCGLKGKHMPKCADKKESFFYYDKNEIKKIEVRVFTASNQEGKKI